MINTPKNTNAGLNTHVPVSNKEVNVIRIFNGRTPDYQGDVSTSSQTGKEIKKSDHFVGEHVLYAK